MNYIQRAWLVALKPVVSLVNDKLAKRSGALGKLGRFFSFGPRQFGYHPINRYFSLVNLFVVQYIGFMMHRYSFMKGLTQNGYHYFRSYKFASLVGPTLIMFNVVYMGLPPAAQTDDSETLNLLSSSLLRTNASSLNHRTSAHYTEINDLYSMQMIKKVDALRSDIINDRSHQNNMTKKTRYARPGYKYIQAHSNAQ